MLLSSYVSVIIIGPGPLSLSVQNRFSLPLIPPVITLFPLKQCIPAIRIYHSHYYPVLQFKLILNYSLYLGHFDYSIVLLFPLFLLPNCPIWWSLAYRLLLYNISDLHPISSSDLNHPSQLSSFYLGILLPCNKCKIIWFSSFVIFAANMPPWRAISWLVRL